MKPVKLSTIAVFAACAASSAIAPAKAEMIEHKTVFDVKFGILSIGKATFDIRFDKDRYILDMNGKTVGVAEMVAPGSGEVESEGRIGDNGVVAEKHEVVFHDKKKDKDKKLEMSFKDGGVESVKLDPDKHKDKSGPKWVPISADQLRSVIDPASSIIVPVEWSHANDPKAVCDRQLNVYDGDTRFDIQLKYKSTKPISTKGYKGYAYVCSLRYIPVAGHKKKQRNIEYMSHNKDMEIWLAPMAKTNLYTPIRIEVPTWVGTFSALPDYFGVVSR
ncbi:MAG: DUF3108 domain-containing protein [Salaquimonas sp.]|nr:DUF3108 domain-containing protein [Salaquimonas sp.]